MPARQRRVGLQEIGLPYAADAAMTRHMARFLRQQAASVEHGSVRRGPSGLACPTHVLFNGGVLHAGLVRERILGTLNAWLAEEGMKPVEAADGRRSDARRVARRGLLRAGAARQRRAHPRRRAAHLLCRHRKRDARRCPASPRRSRRWRWCRSAWRRARISASPAASSAWLSASRRSFASSARRSARTISGRHDRGLSATICEELSPMEVNLQASDNAGGSCAGFVRNGGHRNRACCSFGAWRATAAGGSWSSTCASA